MADEGTGARFYGPSKRSSRSPTRTFARSCSRPPAAPASSRAGTPPRSRSRRAEAGLPLAPCGPFSRPCWRVHRKPLFGDRQIALGPRQGPLLQLSQPIVHIVGVYARPPHTQLAVSRRSLPPVCHTQIGTPLPWPAGGDNCCSPGGSCGSRRWTAARCEPGRRRQVQPVVGRGNSHLMAWDLAGPWQLRTTRPRT